jgi:hypothetical protein
MVKHENTRLIFKILHFLIRLSMNQRIKVQLAISRDDYLLCYQGVALDVVARAVDGRTVKFPAKLLKPFITYHGIQGTFEIIFDSESSSGKLGRFKSIQRLA